jgi:hypothetical protein
MLGAKNTATRLHRVGSQEDKKDGRSTVERADRYELRQPTFLSWQRRHKLLPNYCIRASEWNRCPESHEALQALRHGGSVQSWDQASVSRRLL